MMQRVTHVLLSITLAGLMCAGVAQARVQSAVIAQVGLEEKPGNVLPNGVSLTNHEGKVVKSSEWLNQGKPVFLTLNYFRCSTICDKMLFDLSRALKDVEWAPGEGYKVVTISIDPKEDAKEAAKKRNQVFAIADLKEETADWEFLTGPEAEVRKIAEAVGYQYAYDEKTDQWGHPAVFMMISSEGKVMGYRQGLSINSRDLEFSLVEAGEGKIGSLADQLVVSCYQYDDEEGAYVPFAWGVMRAGGALTVLILGGFLTIMFRGERRRNRGEEA